MALVTVQRSPSSNNSPSHENSGFQDEIETNNSKSLSECYFAGKGTALVLPDADATSKSAGTGGSGNPASNGRISSGTGGNLGSSIIQKHLQSMFYLLRPEETLKMAVKLESVHSARTRYLVVVSRMGSRGEESCLLGIDCNEKTTVGLVLRVLANTQLTLDGDGGFSVSICDRHHIFKPVSVQAMWSTLQTLHKVSAKAREQNYFQGGLTHSWVEYYENRIESDRSCLNEWHAMDNLESKRPPSPDSIRTKPTERDETEKVIRSTLKEIMMSVDLDEVTSKVIRSRLEEELDMDLGEYKSFIDQEMLVILGQMDAPTEIFDHVYLGSEWNASNYEELRRNGVGHILNVTREIDNFFPGTFDYLNVRVYDDEKTDLLKHWDDTYKYITKVKEQGSKVLVHCKMGVSRSASVVVAYAMKACNWDFETALKHVKEKRSCIKPNTSFLLQLETYQGILDAMKNKEKLQRSKSETNLKSPGTNGKNDKVSVGTDPPPAVQTLSKSFNIDNTMSGQALRNIGSRPKSWSPDNLSTRQMVEAAKSPLSISLEDVSQKSASKESIKGLESKSSLARHVLMPCDNGETYSVSPNQIVHLPDTNPCRSTERKNLVLDLASQFEKVELVVKDNYNANFTDKNTNRATEIKMETWDPGEVTDSKVTCCETSSETCDQKNFSLSENRTVWTSSTIVKTESAVPVSCSNNLVKIPDCIKSKTVASLRECDPFSNQLDRVFDREEKKQLRMSTIPVISSGCGSELSNDDKSKRDSPSRQSSWSSYDSAVALGFQNEPSELSRHSSWGSGDTRAVPSRNSSWGSYDMQPRGPVHYINERGEKVVHNNFGESVENGFPLDKEDLPWQTGTVRRSKQKIQDGKTSGSESSSETLLFDLIPDLAESINTVTIDEPIVSSAISEKIDIPKDEHKLPVVSTRLSISAPEQSSMELIKQDESLSRSASNVSSNSVISTAQCSSVKQHKNFLENLHNSTSVTKKTDDLLDGANSSGKVKNLKKEFEAKSSTITDQIEMPENASKTKVNSLPSSPLSVHVVKEKKSISSSDDVNLKNLIGIFENNANVDNVQVNRRQKFHTTNNSSRPFTQNRNTRYSCIEVSVEKTPRILQTPLISNLDKNGSVVDKSEDKRPPIVPVVRTAASPGLVVAATVITAAKKKQQQYGKSHPLARLNIKPRHNNPVYNTM